MARCRLRFGLCRSVVRNFITMLLDSLENAARFEAHHPGFARAFAFLAGTDLSALAPGRHEIDGDRIFVLIDHKEGRGNDGARLEAHRRYVDVQYTIEGQEEIGFAPIATCRRPAGEFDEQKDVILFDDRPMTWLAVPPGQFAIFFPHDAHAPFAGTGFLKKAIVKVAYASKAVAATPPRL
jgi:YhcH/YjgK/YiaL family protein